MPCYLVKCLGLSPWWKEVLQLLCSVRSAAGLLVPVLVPVLVPGLGPGAGPGAGPRAGPGQQFSRHAQAHGWPHRTAFP